MQMSNLQYNCIFRAKLVRFFHHPNYVFFGSMLRVWCQMCDVFPFQFRKAGEKMYVSQDTFNMPLLYIFFPAKSFFPTRTSYILQRISTCLLNYCIFSKKSHFESQFEQVTLESTAQQHIRRTIDFPISDPFYHRLRLNSSAFKVAFLLYTLTFFRIQARVAFS